MRLYWHLTEHPRHRAALLLVAVLALLFLIYLPTLMTTINGGGGRPYTDDVGEFQVALNVWGTVHSSGYPLFLMIGNVMTSVFRAVSVNPAAAASLVATTWGLIALGIFYGLVLRLTGRLEIAAVTTLLLGLTRSVWINNVIAEEYGMNSALELILLAIVFWPPGITPQNVRRRVWLLALVGGIAVAHHRTIMLMAPGLLWAVWPCLRGQRRRLAITLGLALIIGLIGFIPYIYLPARAWAHGIWVYGDPGTLPGFWEQFMGVDAAPFMHLPPTPQAWLDDFVDTFRILLDELTPVPALACALALAVSIKWSRFRREARIAFVCTWSYFLFLFALHYVVKPQAVAMPIVLVLVLELAFALDMIRLPMGFGRRLSSATLNRLAVVVIGLTFAVLCGLAQYQPIFLMTHDDTGLKMIELAKQTPRDGGRAVFMLPWGPRYHAVAYSKYLTGENADLPIVDHNGRFGELAAKGHAIYTSKDTFYQFPLAWWDGQIGRAYLSSAGDGLVVIRGAPLTQAAGPGTPIAHGVVLRSFALCTDKDTIHLTITWSAARTPDADLSVFTHLLDADGKLIAQADSSTPVYGWYPTSRWSAGEIIYDNYVLPRLPGSARLAFGMYEQPEPGKFVNYGTQEAPILSVFNCASR